MTDEEGGEIQRMANLVGNLPWPRTMAATMTPGQVRALAGQVGRRMRAAGITMDLAPVLDLSDSPGPDATYPDGPRSFSVHPAVATAYGLAFARGLQDGGVIPVLKHFPGLGQASANTDFGRATDPPLGTLEAGALLPFEAAIKDGLPAVMVGEVSVPGLTHGLPATLSSQAITGLLRGRLGFHGLVLTDSLSAAAIQEPVTASRGRRCAPSRRAPTWSPSTPRIPRPPPARSSPASSRPCALVSCRRPGWTAPCSTCSGSRDDPSAADRDRSSAACWYLW